MTPSFIRPFSTFNPGSFPSHHDVCSQFVVRHDILNRVLAALCTKPPPHILLEGGPGSGKTMLLARVASYLSRREYRHLFPVHLPEDNPPLFTAADFQLAVKRALGLTNHSGDPLQLVARDNANDERHVVLLVEDLQHLDQKPANKPDATTPLTQILSALHGSRFTLLATTTRPLHAPDSLAPFRLTLSACQNAPLYGTPLPAPTSPPRPSHHCTS